MKITKKILEKIIKEELENITNQDKQQINEAPVEFMNNTRASLGRIEELLKQLVASRGA